MEKITERELVERFGTDAHLKRYEERGKLVGDLKQRVMERAKKCCDVTPLEHKMYKLTAIKSDRYINKSMRTSNDVYKNLLPVMMSVLNLEKSSQDWRLIAIKANIVDPRLFVWSRNSIIVSEISDKTIEETYAFFGRCKEFIKYYIEKGLGYLINDGFVTCENDDGLIQVSILNNPYARISINKCTNNTIKMISQKICDSVSKDWKPFIDILFGKKLSKKASLIKDNLDKLIPIDLFNEEILSFGIREKNQKNNLNIDRNTPEYFAWKESVLRRDNYTCQCCGFTENLQAHHIENYADNEDLRIDVDNGITLCEGCHAVYSMGSFHNIFGTRHNTRKQLELYLSKYGKIRKAIQDILMEDM